MISKIKSFYHKTNFDWSANDVDPFEYHKTFYMILKLFRVNDIGNLRTTWFNQNLLIFICGVSTVVIAIVSVYHGIDTLDISYTTESLSYLLVLSYEVIIVTSTKLNLVEYHNFLKSMKIDFSYVCGPGKKYKAKFFVNQLITWKVSTVTAIFTYGISIGMVLFACFALLYFLINYKPGDKWERPLLFPIWYRDVNFFESPTYEIVFVFTDICVLLYAHNYVFMMQTQIVWIRHLMTKADLVIWSIEDFFEDVQPSKNVEEKRLFSIVLKERMREIVQLHQSMYSLMDDYFKVYKKMLLFEQVFHGPTICLTAYCSIEKLERGEVQLILIQLCVATTALFFIPNYLCTLLETKVHSICDACWSTSFWNAGNDIRPYFVMIMQKSYLPLPFKVPGFEEINLNTFSKKMASAYSCFNMLRQANHRD